MRLDLQKDESQLVSPMRPNCHDGVTVANGLLYWWPSVCDCDLTLYGITCLGPAGDFDFEQQRHRERQAGNRRRAQSAGASPVTVDASDWPTFRANNQGTVTASAPLRAKAKLLWDYVPKTAYTPSAPTAADALAFVSGSDGVIRALDVKSGKEAWTAFTGGEVRLPPTLAKGRALASSADGWVYSLDAKTGKRVWRFRAAPIERRIPIYGTLQSTWPAASGVLVDKGVAYVAAGLANYDGTHVYALDAESGQIRWQNNGSGHLDAESHTGVGVQGHLLIHDGKLFLAGGNAVSPAEYDLATGECLNSQSVARVRGASLQMGSTRPRGWELYVVGDGIRVAGKPYYAHPKYPVFDSTVYQQDAVRHGWRLRSRLGQQHQAAVLRQPSGQTALTSREASGARLRRSWRSRPGNSTARRASPWPCAPTRSSLPLRLKSSRSVCKTLACFGDRLCRLPRSRGVLRSIARAKSLSRSKAGACFASDNRSPERSAKPRGLGLVLLKPSPSGEGDDCQRWEALPSMNIRRRSKAPSPLRRAVRGIAARLLDTASTPYLVIWTGTRPMRKLSTTIAILGSSAVPIKHGPGRRHDQAQFGHHPH